MQKSRLTTSVIVLMTLLFLPKEARTQDFKWTPGGRPNCVSAGVTLTYPLHAKFQTDMALTLSHRRVFSPKVESEIGVWTGAYRYFVPPAAARDRDWSTTGRVRHLGYQVGVRLYRTRKNRGFAPLGGYISVGGMYNSVRTSFEQQMVPMPRYPIWVTHIPESSVKTREGIIYLGIGNEFSISERLFWGFNLSGCLTFNTDYVATESEFPDVQEVLDSRRFGAQQYQRTGNLFLSRFNISYRI